MTIPTVSLSTWKSALESLQYTSTSSSTSSASLLYAPSKHQINELIRNYLATSAHYDALKTFERESGLVGSSEDTESMNDDEEEGNDAHMQDSMSPTYDESLLKERDSIREHIHHGRLEEAISHLNQLDPQIMGQNKNVSFHLKRQQMIEMIRHGKIAEVLQFAREQMKFETNEVYQKEIEDTMTLLAFAGAENSPVQNLLSVDKRQETAALVNSAILEARHEVSEPELPKLLRLLDWGQEQLAQKMRFPQIKDFETATLEDPSRE